MLPQKAEERSSCKFLSQQPFFQPTGNKSNARPGGADAVLTHSFSAWRKKYPLLKSSSAIYCFCNAQQYEEFSDLTVLWREAKAKFYYYLLNFYSFYSHKHVLLSPRETLTTIASFLVPYTGFN